MWRLRITDVVQGINWNLTITLSAFVQHGKPPEARTPEYKFNHSALYLWIIGGLWNKGMGWCKLSHIFSKSWIKHLERKWIQKHIKFQLLERFLSFNDTVLVAGFFCAFGSICFPINPHCAHIQQYNVSLLPWVYRKLKHKTSNRLFLLTEDMS